MALSPMLVHAIESFTHGIEHYLDGSPRSRKFALLHVDHAIELMLKEKNVQLGKAIYKQDGQTLSIHETLNSLDKEGIALPEKARIQEIHDLRNVVQHKGLTPDEDTTKFFIEQAYTFFKRFVTTELGLTFAEVLPPKYIRLMEGAPVSLPDVRPDLKATQELSGSPVEQVIAGYTILERLAEPVQVGPEKRVSLRKALVEIATEQDADVEKVRVLVEKIVQLRSKVVHGAFVPTEADATRFLGWVGQTLRLLGAFKQYG